MIIATNEKAINYLVLFATIQFQFPAHVEAVLNRSLDT